MAETGKGETRTYAVAGESRLKRLWLASFLGALAAIVLVTLAGLALGLGVQALYNLLFGDSLGFNSDSLIASGFTAAMLACIFNWYFFWVSVPVTLLVLRFVLGRLPQRGIIHSRPYLVSGAIIGAVLVALPCALAGYLVGPNLGAMSSEPAKAATALWAAVCGALIGALCGLGVGATWRLIVRPQSQIRVFNPAETF